MTGQPIHQIARKIHESRRLVISSHLRPDGDSICTGLALALMGEVLGKEMVILNHDPTPFPFTQAPDIERVRVGPIFPQPFDAVIFLECANVARSGHENLEGYFKINIDHHYSNDAYADINWINPQASAVGEMVFELGQALGLSLTPRIAEHLYCAIVSDTGCFQFSNTSARAFEVSFQLIKLGANPVRITELLYNNSSAEKVKLLGQVLSTLRMTGHGTIAVITMFRSLLQDLDLKETDTEDITTLARSIKGVETVLFFKEIEPGVFRVSIRSKGNANAAEIAEHFGGGGHVHAAGFTVVGEYDRLVREVPLAVEKLLAREKTAARPESR